MTLGITKSYTPTSGQVPAVLGYNTDVAALFDAFTNLEAQTATLGGLTITPLTNSIITFKTSNSSIASIFSVDTIDNVAKFTNYSVVSQNIGSSGQVNFIPLTTLAWANVASSAVSLTLLKESAKVMANVSFRAIRNSVNSGKLQFRIKMVASDNTTTYKYLGGHHINLGDTDCTMNFPALLSSLNPDSYTFSLEIYNYTTAFIYDLLELTVWEI